MEEQGGEAKRDGEAWVVGRMGARGAAALGAAAVDAAVVVLVACVACASLVRGELWWW